MRKTDIPEIRARVFSRRGGTLPLALALALFFDLHPVRLAAEDFASHEPGSRAASLGGAFAGRADDASAVFYNPAGLAFLKGIRFKIGLGFGDRAIKADWLAGGTALRSDPNEFLGSLALAWQPIPHLTLSVGLFSPYSYKASWSPNFGTDWICRENSLRATSLRSVAAFEVFKGFAVGAGVDLVKSSVGWKHFVTLDPATYAESRHRLRGSGLGFVASVLWKIAPAIQIGARYHGPVTVDLSGSTYRIYYITGSGGISSGLPSGPFTPTFQAADDPYGYWPYQDVVGRLTFPSELAVGAAFTPVPKLSLFTDVQRDRWRDFGDWIFEPAESGDETDYGIQGIPLGLGDTTQIKAGVELRPARHLALRAGYAHMESSVNEANRTMIYPDLERNIYTFGFGYEGPVFSIYGGGERVSDLSFDLFVRYAAAVPASSTVSGYEMTYSSRRIDFGVGVGFAF